MSKINLKIPLRLLCVFEKNTEKIQGRKFIQGLSHMKVGFILGHQKFSHFDFSK